MGFYDVGVLFVIAAVANRGLDEGNIGSVEMLSELTCVSRTCAKVTHVKISVPLYSHTRTILEFCKRLAHLHQDIHITCINPTVKSSCNDVKALFENLPPNIDSMFLPPVNLDDMPEKPHIPILVHATITSSLPSIYNALKTLHCSSNSIGLTSIVVDVLITQVLPMANELNVLSYVYFSSTAMLLSLCLYPSTFDKTISCETVEIPGCMLIHTTDLPDPVQNRFRCSEEYKVFLEGNKRFYLADGVIINSFFDLEPETFRALQENKGTSSTSIPHVYPVGPLVQEGSCETHESQGNEGETHEYMRWLDKQEQNSVLYVSFGSAGTLTHDQFNELALGLELSGEKFLWVIRPPQKLEMIGDLSVGHEDPLEFLPNGFLERTKGQGFVVPYWADQIEILGHGAIGGFLCHCGWNSMLESTLHGIPIVAWPLYADQKMIAALFSDGLKVALRPKPNEKGIVGRGVVAEVIKNILVGEEGKEIQQRMKRLQDVAIDALKEDGSSTRTITQLALKWKRSTV
ncbi:hydroquinone glucosyltransferase-like [Lotus japonicus]|uniref:hydroquinone glucosyltransferase-like n=1 Tax=Lotus japonicus TaxID=34305 RepID=UPI002585F32C|nr:hydroquinone glucosyltransferase-like [Lotus japonicus]